MMNIDMELRVNRKNTLAFIAARPTVVTLVPQLNSKQPGGGKRWTDLDPRKPQTLRIIELGTNVSPQIITTTDGEQREAEFWLLGPHDAIMAPNDHWTAIDGREWIIGDVIRSNGYEVRGLVAERGK